MYIYFYCVSVSGWFSEWPAWGWLVTDALSHTSICKLPSTVFIQLISMRNFEFPFFFQLNCKEAKRLIKHTWTKNVIYLRELPAMRSFFLRIIAMKYLCNSQYWNRWWTNDKDMNARHLALRLRKWYRSTDPVHSFPRVSPT